MNLANSREKDQVQMPEDFDAVKVLLEKAEIDYEEAPDTEDNGITSLTLENGIEFTFDHNRLVGIHNL